MTLQGRIVVFSVTGCPHCKAAKEKLTSLNLPYNDINLDDHPEKRYFKVLVYLICIYTAGRQAITMFYVLTYILLFEIAQRLLTNSSISPPWLFVVVESVERLKFVEVFGFKIVQKLFVMNFTCLVDQCSLFWPCILAKLNQLI